MTIFIDAPTPTSLDNYDDLLIAVEAWLNRTDLSDRVPDFIRLAEARFRRMLVMPDMETQVTFDAKAGLPVPTDLDSILSITLLGLRPLELMSPTGFETLPPGCKGTPSKYTLVAGNIVLWPAPDQCYKALLTYRANLPSLAAGVQSNWLLAKHPDAYLFGALVQAEFYGWNDDRLPLVKGALDEILDEITKTGNRARYGGGPLIQRPAVREGLHNRTYR